MKNTNLLSSLSKEKVKEILNQILEAYLNPAFGTLPKKEIDLLIFRALEDIGYISSTSSLWIKK